MKLKRMLSIAMVVALLMTSFALASAQTITRKDGAANQSYNGNTEISLIGRIKVTMTNRTNGYAVLYLEKLADFVNIPVNGEMKSYPNEAAIQLQLAPKKGTDFKKKYHNKDVLVRGKLLAKPPYGMTNCYLEGLDGKAVKPEALKKPKSVKVTGDSHELNVGKTMQLSATIKPANALQMVGSWSSTNKKVATVDSNGKVTAVKKGTCYITAKTVNGKTNQWKVKVLATTGVTISESAITLDVGKTKTIKCTVSPAGTGGGLRVEVDNASVASISESGGNVVVTGIKPGTATITASTQDGLYKATCQVTVLGTGEVDKLTKIELKLDGNGLMAVGGTMQTSLVLTPENTKKPALTWVSSNPNVASVNADGLITGKAQGMTIIEARTKVFPQGQTTPLIGTAIVYVTANPNVGEKVLTAEDLKVTFKGTTIDLKAGLDSFMAAVPGYTQSTTTDGLNTYSGKDLDGGVNFACWYQENGKFYFFSTAAGDTSFKTKRGIAGGSTSEQMLTSFGAPGIATNDLALEHTFDTAGNVTEAKYKVFATYYVGSNYLRFRLDMVNQKIEYFVAG